MTEEKFSIGKFAGESLADAFDGGYLVSKDFVNDINWYATHKQPSWWYKQPWYFIMERLPHKLYKKLQNKYWKEVEVTDES